MALALANGVQETTSTTGTGTISLAGAVSNFQTFVAGIGSGNTTYYRIAGGGQWEVGIGTVTSGSPDTLSRDTVLESSNSDSLVSFSSGSKSVTCVIAAEYGWPIMRVAAGGVEVASTGDMLPTTDASFDVGSSSKRFTDGYFSGGVYLGGTASANYLADYEEGSWTPTIGGTGGATGQTYVTQVGRYVKIGKVVHLQATIQLSAKGTFTGSYVNLHGLPFTSHAASYSILNVSYMTGMNSAVDSPALYMDASSVIPKFIGLSGTDRDINGFPQSAVSDDTFIILGGSYIAAS